MFDNNGGNEDSGMSFGELMKSYESRQGEGVLIGNDQQVKGGFAYSFQSKFEVFGQSLSSGMKSIGQSNYVKGTPFEIVDMEAGDAANAGEESTMASINSLSRTDRFKGFVGLLLLSLFFFSLSLFFLGVAVIFPAKFAFPFTMGSVTFMGAFALLKGPWNWAKSVFAFDQLPFTMAYFLSIFGTLYSCLVWQSYIFIIGFSIMQLFALGYYAFGNMPGGQYGLRMITAFVKQLVKNVCWPCAKGCVKLFTSMFR